ncbi:hypothetical protein [Streptomyces katrae]|uniref:hypothetical protein n=1 Tax=Streptomyces katrae TaxID=68223 RepID=UPI0004C13D3E|nr:hypothetical protein [Streptomyces katrae]
MDLTLVKVVETCTACPSQWDAWAADGQYLYMRYRFGIGTVERQPSPDVDTWSTEGSVIASFGESSLDGCIDLDDFLAEAGLSLAPDADVS